MNYFITVYSLLFWWIYMYNVSYDFHDNFWQIGQSLEASSVMPTTMKPTTHTHAHHHTRTTHEPTEMESFSFYYDYISVCYTVDLCNNLLTTHQNPFFFSCNNEQLIQCNQFNIGEVEEILTRTYTSILTNVITYRSFKNSFSSRFTTL